MALEIDLVPFLSSFWKFFVVVNYDYAWILCGKQERTERYTFTYDVLMHMGRKGKEGTDLRTFQSQQRERRRRKWR